MKRPDLKTSSVDEFASIANGKFFGEVSDPMIPYGPIKYMAALWMSSLSRKYPNVRFVTMSPGATSGTNAMETLTPAKKLMFTMMFKLFALLGRSHGLETGAKRFVDGIQDDSYKSGVFYASKKGTSGTIVDQATLFSDLNNQDFQDNANEAIHQYIR